MIVVRATQRLLKSSRVTPEIDPPPADAPLAEWFANVVSLPFPGRMVVMYTSANTLLTLVAPGRVLRTTVPVFVRRLPALLQRLNLPEPWIASQSAALSD